MSDIDPLDNPALEDALGGLRRGDDSRVFHPDKAIIITKDGNLIEPLDEATSGRERHRHLLWSRIGPLRWGDVVIKANTELWHEEREEWLRAELVNVYADGEPVITFKVKNTLDPVVLLKYDGSTIADLVADGTLKSKLEVNDRMEELIGLKDGDHDE